jgi:pimeloyl-ACP methyl ester carboxylesterase
MSEGTEPGFDSLVLHHTSEGIGYYSRPGKGPTAVVLVHGMGGSAHNWRLVVPLLPVNAPVVAIDLPWCGSSRHYRGPSGEEGMLNSVAACVAEAWPGPVIVAAHSIGGYFAWRLSSSQKRSVTGLVLVSCQLFTVSDVLKHLLSLRNLRLRLSLANAVLRALVPPGRLVRALISHSKITQYVLLWPMLNPELLTRTEQVGACFEGNGGIGALKMLNMARRIDLLQVARASDTPASAVYGSSDPIITPRDSQLLEGLQAVRSVESVPGGGHFPIIEAPALVAAAITERLTG